METKPAFRGKFCRKAIILAIILSLIILSVPIDLVLAQGQTRQEGFTSPNKYEQERNKCEQKYPRGGSRWSRFKNWVRRGGCKAWAAVTHPIDFVSAIGFDIILTYFRNKTMKLLGRMGTHMNNMILEMTPDLSAQPRAAIIQDVHRTIFTILIPFYALNILLVGVYLIFTSVEPSKRARAKDMLQKVIVSMLLVSVSPEIYRILVTISNAFSVQMMNAVQTQINAIAGGAPADTLSWTGMFFGTVFAVILANPGFALLFIICMLLLYLLIIIFLAVRYAMIVMFYMLFPFILFCYFFDYTRNLGGDLLSRAFMWILVGPVMCLVLSLTIFVAIVTVDISFENASSGTVRSIGHVRAAQDINAGVTDPNRVNVDKLIIQGDDGIDVTAPGDRISFFDCFVLLLMILAGFAGVLVVPLLMTGLMKWAGAGVSAAGMNAMAKAEGRSERWKAFGMIAAGNYMMGQGGAGLVGAGVQASRARPDMFERPSEDMIPSLGSMGSGFWRMGQSGVSKVAGMFTGGGGAGGAAASGGGPASGGGATTIARQASAPFRAMGGVLGNFFGAFSSPQAKQGEAMADFSRMMGYEGKEYGGQPFSRSGSRGALGGDAGRYADEIKAGEGAPTRPLEGANLSAMSVGADGKAISPGTNRYTSGVSADDNIQTNESYGWVIPKLQIWNRMDNLWEGGADVFKGFVSQGILGGGEGRSVGFATGMRGLGKVLWSLRPISIFFPIRIAGAILYNIAPELLPPILQTPAKWLGMRMSGLGFRGMYDRVYVGQRLKSLERSFVNASTSDERERYGTQYVQLMDSIGYHGNLTGGTNYSVYASELNRLEGSNANLFDLYMERGRQTKLGKNVGGMRDDLSGFLSDVVHPSSSVGEAMSKFDEKKHSLQFAGLAYYMHTQDPSLGFDRVSRIEDLTPAQFDAMKAVNPASLGERDVLTIAAGMQAQQLGYGSVGEKDAFISGLAGGNRDLGVDKVVSASGSGDNAVVYARNYFELDDKDLSTAVGNEVYMSHELLDRLMKRGYTREEAAAKIGIRNVRLWKSGSGKFYMEAAQINYLHRKDAFDNPSYEDTAADLHGIGLRRNGVVGYIVGYDSDMKPVFNTDPSVDQSALPFDGNYKRVIIKRLTEGEKKGGVPEFITDASGRKHAVIDISGTFEYDQGSGSYKRTSRGGRHLIEGNSSMIIVEGEDGRYYHLGQNHVIRRGSRHEFVASDFVNRESVMTDRDDMGNALSNEQAAERYKKVRNEYGVTDALGMDFLRAKGEYDRLRRRVYVRNTDVEDLKHARFTRDEEDRIDTNMRRLRSDYDAFFTSDKRQRAGESETDYRERLKAAGHIEGEIEGMVALSKLGRVVSGRSAADVDRGIAGYISGIRVANISSQAELGALHTELGVLGFNDSEIGSVINTAPNASSWRDEDIYRAMNSVVDSVERMNGEVSPADRVRLMSVSMYYDNRDPNQAVVLARDGKIHVRVNAAYLDKLKARYGDAEAMKKFNEHLMSHIIPHEFSHDYAARNQDRIEARMLDGMSASEKAVYTGTRKYFGDGFFSASRETVANARKLPGRNEPAYQESVREVLEAARDNYMSAAVIRNSDLANMANLRVLAIKSGQMDRAREFDEIAKQTFGEFSPQFMQYQSLGGSGSGAGIFGRLYDQEETG